MSLRKRIVILGGGVGALTTAYYLTSKPGWQQECEITVYQLGWRLGGKGASSRRDSEIGLRIEEHGLHVWFGFYENAFTLMRACYRELGRPWEEAFKHQDDIHLMEDVEGRWSLWRLPFPKLAGEPGKGNAEHSPWHVLISLVDFVRDYVDEWLKGVPTDKQTALQMSARAKRSPLGTPLHHALDLMRALDPDPARHEPRLHRTIVVWLRKFRRWVEREMREQTARRSWYVVDLGLSVAIGILADDLLRKGLRSIDDRDFRAWLSTHGATDATLAAPPLRALYDCCFAYEDGDLERPNFAAGVALGCALRIALMYRGHVLYEMRAGMGDIVVAPLYELLAKRGVKFEFFQSVKRLELSRDRRSIARIHFGKQVTLKDGGYEPLAASGKLRYWPNTPRYEQIKEGAQLKQENIDLESHWTPWKDVGTWALDVGEQDRVVLGISLGGLASICEELCRASADWKNLIDKLPSIQTQSIQLWLTRDLQGLGWQGPPPAMVAAPEPLDVWADMSHLIDAERWPPKNSPRSIQYFCGPMPGNLLSRPPGDHDVPKEAWQAVRKQAIDWFGRYTGWFWPKAVTPPGSKTLDWTLLFGSQAAGEERIDSQWLHANINPTERYVLSPAKSNAYRLPADESGFDNLVLAGDWTRTAIDAGCVEAAVISGMGASRALCGYPETIHGENFMQADDRELARNALRRGVVFDNDKRTKVAILGSGCGAMSAAFWLSATEELRRTYAVTVYTQGWRLGGKAASGRINDGSARIEEHGLHMMMGFYETAFHVIQACYRRRDKQPDDAFPTWQQAFEPQRQITLWLKMPPAQQIYQWQPWNIGFTKLPGTPGHSKMSLEPDTSYMNQAVHRVLELLHGALTDVERVLGKSKWLELLAQLMSRSIESRRDFFVEENRRWLIDELKRNHSLFKKYLAPELRKGAQLTANLRFDAYRSYLLIDLGYAGLIGYLTDVLPLGERGYHRINQHDFKDWLVSHQADQESAESPLVMSLYDLAFAYKNGDSSDPKFGLAAAGAMLRLLIKMAFTYRDAPLWKMNAGMGDVIFTPLYQLLVKSGVRFEFFNRVTGLHLAADGGTIGSIDLDQQVRTKNGCYRPLRRTRFPDGKSWECWPAEPLWEQIEDGDVLSKKGLNLEDPWTDFHVGSRTLEFGKDFEMVILSIPPAASEHLTKELKRNQGWSDMLSNMTAVATQSVQLWLKPDLQGLGWPHGPTVATTYANPLRSWGEMSQVLPRESWPAARTPQSCEYLCGTYVPTLTSPQPGQNQPDYLRGQTNVVEEMASAWLKSNCKVPWPNVCDVNGALDRNQVVSVYYRVNVGYSERYVQSFPGSIQYRLEPGKSGFDNLFLAGDWTVTSINGGCAEAAFESGMRAACAITGAPPPTPD